MMQTVGKRCFNMYTKRHFTRLPPPYYQGNDIGLRMNELRWDIHETIDDRFSTLQKEIKKSNKEIADLTFKVKELETKITMAGIDKMDRYRHYHIELD